jgi:hypothetical protein
MTLLALLLFSCQEAEAVGKAARFLVESQEQDGSWRTEIGESREPGMRIAVTALCAHALLAADPSPVSVESARKGLAFIRANLDALDGPFEANPSFNFNSWGVCFGLIHLHGLSKRWPGPKPDIQSIIDSLVKKAEKTQLPCGGWTYLKKTRSGGDVKDGSVSFLTASMIEGLLRWKGEGHKGAEKLLPRAVADLEKILGTKDGLPYSHEGDYNAGLGGDHALRTVQGRLTLLEAGKGTPDALEESLALFFKARGDFEKLRNTYAHTPPTMIAGYYYYFGHLHVARAIRRLGRDPADRAGLVRRTFLKEQLEDGSWKDVEAGGKSCGTAMVLLALDELGTILWRAPVDEALKAAKEESKPVLVFLSDGKKEGAETEKAMREPPVLELLQQFACIRVAISKDDPVCKKTKITSGCAILVLDPKAEDPFEKPLKKWTGRRSAKPLREDLAKILKDWGK